MLTEQRLTTARHVRVHHVDKDKDDPQLREVLAQRPEGGSRGRRRRVSDVSLADHRIPNLPLLMTT